jgi:hypothetical protein
VLYVTMGYMPISVVKNHWSWCIILHQCPSVVFPNKNHVVKHVVINCQGHEKPQEQKIKERSKFNFQTRNKIRLRDSKIRT